MHAANTYPLGKTAVSGELEHLLGQIGEFKDLDPASAPGGVKKQLSEMKVCARWCKNESGGALTAGTIVTWDTGSTYGPGKAVGAAAVSGTTIGVGVIDPHLPSAGVANDAHCWVIYFGPCRFKFTTGTALGIGDQLSLGAAGRVVDFDHTSLTDQLLFDRCGKALAAVGAGSANDTLFRGFADFRF